jgi:hypothetical protein
MKKIVIALALLAAPALAAASPEVAARQTPAPQTIVIHARSLLCERILANRFRVVRVLPLRVTLESIAGTRVRFTVHVGFNTAVSLRPGEIVRLKIVPVRP